MHVCRWLKHKDEYLKLCEKNCLKSQSADKLYSTSEDSKMAITFERPRPPHEEAHRRIVRQDLEKVTWMGTATHIAHCAHECMHACMRCQQRFVHVHCISCTEPPGHTAHRFLSAVVLVLVCCSVL